MKTMNAWTLITVPGMAGRELANETVKARGPSHKPGRAVDGDIGTSGGRAGKPGREPEPAK